MALEEFQDLRLVGGTALALHLGHRLSIDIDLFGCIDFRTHDINHILSQFGDVQPLAQSKSIRVFRIDDIKVDFVNYPYNWLHDAITCDGIRLASLSDIAAMKLNAITGRGSRKDFVDLYFLLTSVFSFEEMIKFFTTKYPKGNLFQLEKSLMYFDDAEKEPIPEMIIDITWPEIKSFIMHKYKF